MAEKTKKPTTNNKKENKETKETKSTKVTKQKDNKNIIIAVCCGIALVVIVILAVVLTKGNGLNDSYFVSDGTKYVLTIESDDLEESGDEEDYMPLKTHLVYTYEGDKITGLKTYYEYADGNAAKKAFDAMKEAASESEEDLGQLEINGKYVIATADEEAYKDLTPEKVKSQIEFMEMLKNTDTSESDTEVDTSDEEVEEDEEDSDSEDE